MQQDDPEREGIVIYTLETKTYERLVDKGTDPKWLRDGRRLLFVDEGKLYLLDRQSRTPRLVLAEDPGVSIGDYSLSPDERTLYYIRSTLEGDIWMANLGAPAP